MHFSTRQLFLAQLLALTGCRSAVAVGTAAPPTISSGGIRYVSLSYMARLYTMRLTQTSDRIRLENKWNKVEIENNSRRCWINGVMVWLHHPSQKLRSDWVIRELDFGKMIDPILRAYAHVPSKKAQIVVLDAGHGGKDAGTTGARGVPEKTVVLDVARRVQALLKGKGVIVKMTRSSDEYPSLQQRCDLAAKMNADLFISIHADGVIDPQAHGTGTFILSAAGSHSTNDYGSGKGNTSPVKGNSYDAANAVLGYSLHSNLMKQWRRSDRGLRRARYFVLKNAPCPAALVECAFLSNLEEEALLNEPANRQAVAKGIANGIQAYVTQVNRKR